MKNWVFSTKLRLSAAAFSWPDMPVVAACAVFITVVPVPIATATTKAIPRFFMKIILW